MCAHRNCDVWPFQQPVPVIASLMPGHPAVCGEPSGEVMPGFKAGTGLIPVPFAAGPVSAGTCEQADLGRRADQPGAVRHGPTQMSDRIPVRHIPCV